MDRAFLSAIATLCQSLGLLLGLTLAAMPAGARDLWGDSGVILAEEDTPVLARTQRLSPETRPTPIGAPAGAQRGDEAVALRDADPLGPPTDAARDPADALFGSTGVASTPLPGDGRVITAPPIPGREADAPLQGELVFGPPAPQAIEPSPTEDAATVQTDPQTDQSLPAGVELAGTEGPDISGVEFFDPGAQQAPGEGEAEVDVASVYEPAVTVPPTAEPQTPAEPPAPPPQFTSAAYAGLFTGVGLAEGMRLQIDLNDTALTGWFLDSSGQNFRIDGQLANEEGRAQAVVISGGVPIGYMNLQLTNLGLTSLFVPLDEALAPIPGDARQYEFLRTLSPAAQSALEAERAAREAAQRGEAGPPRGRIEVPQSQEGGLREVFPDDEVEGE
jgi:hypothetical protein